MAVSENQVSVALVQYIDSLMGATFDHETFDCVRFAQGWLPGRLDSVPSYTHEDWLKMLVEAGGRDWHLRASDYLAVREGPAKVGDIVWTRGQYELPAFGIASDSVMGYFIYDKSFKGESPIQLRPFEQSPVWVGRIE